MSVSWSNNFTSYKTVKHWGQNKYRDNALQPLSASTILYRYKQSVIFSYKQSEDVVRLSMRHYYNRDQLTEKLTILGHRTAFHNEQYQYRIVNVWELCSAYWGFFFYNSFKVSMPCTNENPVLPYHNRTLHREKNKIHWEW